MTQPSEIDVSVCVVNFNAGPSLPRCLASLSANSAGLSLEFLVVDNHSSDGSVDSLAGAYPGLRLIRNSRNLGFARAANQAMREATGRLLLLSNPDIVVPAGTLATLVERMKTDSRIGILGCQLTDPQGRVMGSCGRFPKPATLLLRSAALDKLLKQSSRMRERLELDYFQFPDRTTTVDGVLGAFMLVSRTAVREVGLLDEDFFLYGEDLDWCWRMKEKGWKVVFCPEVSVVHQQGVCASSEPIRALWHFHSAMYRFYRKHQRQQLPAGLRGIVPVGISLKLLLSLFRHAAGARSGARIYRDFEKSGPDEHHFSGSRQ